MRNSRTILFIGDIVGSAGRKAIKVLLPQIREQHHIDWVVANAENAAGGFGVTEKIYQELKRAGIDVLTDRKSVV